MCTGCIDIFTYRSGASIFVDDRLEDTVNWKKQLSTSHSIATYLKTKTRLVVTWCSAPSRLEHLLFSAPLALKQSRRFAFVLESGVRSLPPSVKSDFSVNFVRLTFRPHLHHMFLRVCLHVVPFRPFFLRSRPLITLVRTFVFAPTVCYAFGGRQSLLLLLGRNVSSALWPWKYC